jgi:hypothetical protein
LTVSRWSLSESLWWSPAALGLDALFDTEPLFADVPAD